ncbi:thioredoxin O2, mitochondrial-like [Papaver somniferum]|uniref:thioredoxin O2, mitochondrial-like n=1 Tax=Papaver somniferum TaxID=3469 RepID=UPI000E6F6A2E|nr:thioredoxin O2, mitochondrial-like [Papaver somniferum]
MKPSSSFASTCVPLFSSLYLSSSARSFCSSSSSRFQVDLILSEQGFNSSLKKAQVLGKLISPVIESLSKKFPHVTTFKVGIDQEEIRRN